MLKLSGGNRALTRMIAVRFHELIEVRRRRILVRMSPHISARGGGSIYVPLHRRVPLGIHAKDGLQKWLQRRSVGQGRRYGKWIPLQNSIREQLDEVGADEGVVGVFRANGFGLRDDGFVV